MTEINIKEMSEFDSFIRSKYMESVLWNNGKPTHPLYLDLWEAWQAATQRDGFKFVPVEADAKMIKAGRYAHDSSGLIGVAYKAMIGAVDE